MRTEIRRSARALLAVAAAGVLAAGLALPAQAAPEDDPTDEQRSKVVTSGRPLHGWRIAVDPGHNGGNAADPGAANHLVSDGRGSLKPCNSVGTQTTSGYAEHAFNLDVALRLTERLERLGATVLLTRSDDVGVGPCVDVRGRFAEDVDADLMVSIHANGSSDPAASGFFAIVADPAMSVSQGEPSLDLAADLVAALEADGFAPSSTVDGAVSARDDLATLNFARRPSVMLELGEMRNPGDAAVMETEDGRQSYADAVADGVVAWTSDREPRD